MVKLSFVGRSLFVGIPVFDSLCYVSAVDAVECSSGTFFIIDKMIVCNLCFQAQQEQHKHTSKFCWSWFHLVLAIGLLKFFVVGAECLPIIHLTATGRTDWHTDGGRLPVWLEAGFPSICPIMLAPLWHPAWPEDRVPCQYIVWKGSLV